ncbi:MAG: L,D-transpeptidase [Bacteroidales bacterium]|nr:L,D-transpeptidase [Bacteroidales bacterium]
MISLVYILYISLVHVPPFLQEKLVQVRKTDNKSYVVAEKELVKKRKKLESDFKTLQRKLEQKTPRQPFFVVNSTANNFRLYKGKKIIREGVCSTGSYIMLKAADERKWVFQTPRGVFRIQGKTTSPVWIKPDWAFIEEGLPVPPVHSNLRYEYGVLGDYALSLGHGYLIHGTLYQRFLGMPVTHGCIRLGDDDLKEVYRTLDISSKVFIY